MSKQGWEESEFPILCHTCLGDNPYVRMSKQQHGKECKICSRPFTVFRWCPGAGMRYKKTEICQTCAKIKNVCQTCVLDLEFGLPTQVRDSIMDVEDNIPRSDVNREFFVQSVEDKLGNSSLVDYGKANSAARETLKKMARTDPYYKRNRAHICSFFVKGKCTRGDECPYRHEMPVENELSHQNIKDRYYGQNDPVAKKILNRTDKGAKLRPPEDPTITNLYLTGITEDITDTDLRNHFYAFGEIKSVVVVKKSKCAFVNYATRASAELAIDRSYNNLSIKGHTIRVQWGRPKAHAPQSEARGEAAQPQMTVDQLLDMGGPPPPPGQGSGSYKYPSADPSLLGTSTRTFRA
ncbi:Rbm22 protein [Polychytrium aggregatum]|uniref:Rbm22 protein n=1 Tax=Polychytrium aggregatum TaxID=110093 RepID=UPI0022FDCADA|nr:Rbm22 protein [Polychytrium aggregatum]KAI9202164.1 Rbm22 protein [Polychytrium aggregatum]